MNWQTSDGVTLKSLRQSAGIGLSVLARKASLSVDQLKQLEDGGSSLFYTEAIKLRAGERVLSILGFRFTEPQTESEDQVNHLVKTSQRIVRLTPPPTSPLDRLNVFCASLLKHQRDIRAKLYLGAKELRGRAWSGLLSNQGQRFFTPTPVGSFAVGVTDMSSTDISSTDIGSSNFIKSLWHSTILWALVGTMASLLLVYDFYLQSVQAGWGASGFIDAMQHSPPKLAVGVKSLDEPVKLADNSNTSSAGGATTHDQINAKGKSDEVDQTTSRAINGLASGATTDATTDATACHWQKDAPNLSSLHPSKQGNFVHVMASAPSKLCVIDGSNKLSVLSLGAGASQSIYGTPPFKVFGENLRDLKFYFQGYGIFMPQEVDHQFTLTELPITKEANVAQSVN